MPEAPHRSVLTAALLLGLLGALVEAAGPKGAGIYSILDDLPTGSAGGVGLNGGGYIVSGSLGQVGQSALSGGVIVVSGGYFQSSGTTLSAGLIGQGGGTITFSPPSGEVVVQIPAGAFAAAVTVTLSMPATFPAASSPGGALQGAGVGVQITLDQAVQPAVAVPIAVSYRDSDVAGLDESRLLLARYDAGRNVWVPLVSSPDPSSNRVAARTNHFSIFQVMQANPSATVAAAKAFPNPFRPALGHASVTFSNMPADTTLRIYTLSRELVKDLRANSSGMAAWDGTNQAGGNVASGVYFVFVEGAGERRILKVAVQR